MLWPSACYDFSLTMPTAGFEKSLPVQAFNRFSTHYQHFGRSLSSISLIGGFIFDAVTLKRIDLFWENFWVVAHLLVVGFCIIWIHRDENFAKSNEKGRDLWLIVLQFFLGGLLSTFMVFYFRSGSIWVNWPFYLLLGAAFAANERLKSRYARLEFQVGLFFLSLFCFMIFLLPIVLHSMGRFVFLLSGVISLGLLQLFVGLLRVRGETSIVHSGRAIAVWTAGIFIAMNALYFANLIPPIPLSLQDAAVCRSIARSADGKYLVESEAQGWFGFFRFAADIHAGAGVPVYFYSAVFSPTFLNTDIIHEWQTYDKKGGWVTDDRIALTVRGGRDGGYRTYSMKKDVRTGAWRVNVETPSGAILGRYRFNVLPQSASPVLLKTELKD